MITAELLNGNFLLDYVHRIIVMFIFLTGSTFASYIISKVKLSYSGTVDLSRICIDLPKSLARDRA